MIKFDEFESVDRSSWQKEAERLLKGKPLSKLNWQYEPDIELEPYYDKNNLAPVKANGLGHSLAARGFRIIELLDLNEHTNNRSKNALNVGAEGVFIEAGEKIVDPSAISAIWPEHCWFGMKSDVGSLPEIVSFFESRNADKLEFKGFMGTHWLIKVGTDAEFQIDLDILHESTQALSTFQNIRTVEIPLHLFQEEGSSITLELCLLLGLLKTVIENSQGQNIAIDALPRKIMISTAVGTDFYHEIAKVRAIRKLAYKLFRAYDIPCSLGDFSVIGRTSRVVESSLDSDTNYLRKTTQALSIVMGTADGLSITPFEPNGNDEDARRITRNIGNLIKEESYGHWVQDPLAGSYFVESLTEKLCEEGWERFRMMETEGGCVKWMHDGRLTKSIQEDQNRTWQQVSSGRKRLVGINNFPNAIDKPRLDKLPLGFRHSSKFEALRYQLYQSINNGTLKELPRVLPLTLGSNTAMITARLNFSTNFLGCAGFHLLKEEKFQERNKTTAEVIVICGTDEDYGGLDQKQIAERHKGHQVLIIAGNPANSEELLSMGVDALIHAKSDVLESNTKILKMLKAI